MRALKGFTSFRVIVLIVLGSAVSLRASEDSRPNIVFIMADDLGYGDLGCYGASDIKTPHLDQLAVEGMRFTDAYSNGAVCSPTRIAFLTGRYQQWYGMDNALYYQEMGRGLPEGGETLATRLRKAGYATGLSGKWHLGYDRGRQPLQQGFDWFFGLLGGNHHYFQHMDRIGVADLWSGNDPIEREGYTTDLITDEAIGFIERHADEPFFLFVSHAAPHFPWQGPEDHDKEVVPKKKSWQTGDRETYVAMVESMDHGIGRVLETIESLGLSDDTMVVFTSDNGGHTYSRNAPLRREKGMLWEGGIRVSCLVRWPGKIEAGSTSNQPIITMDWTATFAAMAGEEAIRRSDEGVSLLPIFDGEMVSERMLFWRKKPGPVRKAKIPARAVRYGDWKWYESEDEGSFLFNLAKDIGETNDLSASNPEMLERLQEAHTMWDLQFSESFFRKPLPQF